MIKQIKGFENYRINDRGDIFNQEGCLLVPYITDSGYLRIEINCRHKYIHKLVAETFIDNSLNKPQVNHIDGNKLNNHYLNLEWVTNRENMLHAVANKLTGYNLPLAKQHGADNKPKQVEQCDLLGNVINTYNSVKDAKRKTGWQISGALSGRYKTAKNYIWRYKGK